MSFSVDGPQEQMEKLLGSLYSDFEEVSKENALKLQQILDLEEILYDTRVLDYEDGSPCWCCNVMGEHDKDCERARKATKMFWKNNTIPFTKEDADRLDGTADD